MRCRIQDRVIELDYSRQLIMPLQDRQLNPVMLLCNLAGYKAHEGRMSCMQDFDATEYVR